MPTHQLWLETGIAVAWRQYFYLDMRALEPFWRVAIAAIAACALVCTMLVIA